MKAIIVNAFNAMKEESKQLYGQTIHRLTKLEGTMSNSAQIETLHDVIAVKNELIKLLGETVENLKANLTDRSMLFSQVTRIEVSFPATTIFHG